LKNSGKWNFGGRMKIYVMFLEYDYEGYSEPSLTLDRDIALQYLNTNDGDSMTINVYEIIPDEEIKYIKSYFRRKRGKYIKDIE
jgi:hypothetical protein